MSRVWRDFTLFLHHIRPNSGGILLYIPLIYYRTFCSFLCTKPNRCSEYKFSIVLPEKPNTSQPRNWHVEFFVLCWIIHFFNWRCLGYSKRLNQWKTILDPFCRITSILFKTNFFNNSYSFHVLHDCIIYILPLVTNELSMELDIASFKSIEPGVIWNYTSLSRPTLRISYTSPVSVCKNIDKSAIYTNKEHANKS